ncbi:sulfite exporter TauE/SafE family protein [Lysinibacillus sp. HST-98]|uniref:sulfite exporter TauE/SafE family protein n=1 Tax=Lysinibacillus TaxID=400634 RepID=UPI001926BC97|nr:MULTISPECIES: sulfite exporter TauE/SafE family protein [Lysinibacillus]MBL3730909.1 sulfite exporter TauE/SafE family protein [Lysinibacillus sp. HST-98]MED4701153.1 sulfite exporter TauE/SafE family protein [Lysinibacillus capsici]
MNKMILQLLFVLLSLIGLFYANISLTLVCIGMVAAFIGTIAGGGGLITLPAMMLVGIPIQTSIATNKFSTGISSLSSIFYLLYQKELHLTSIIKYIALAIVGGICGSLLAVSLSEQTMNYMACVLLLLALVITLKNKAWTEVPDSLEHQAPHFWQPFFIAMYDGGFGPGSSTFSILHYLRTHHTYIKAVQLTRVLLFGSCTGAFIVFYHTGFIQWHYAIAMALGSIIGSQLGLLVLPYIPLKIAKTLLTVIIILLLVQVTLKII